MITCYFGVPGVGKTTLLTKIAQEEIKKKRYKNIYTINFSCSGTIEINFDDLGIYKFNESLILIDEITMSADNREFKNFKKEIRDYFILHRHVKCDIIYATQNYENTDKKIRDLTQDLWYMSKTTIPILKNFTRAKKIYRTININEHTSELTLGYRFCNFIESISTSNVKLVWRPKYYKYFDTHDELTLKEREEYKGGEPKEYKKSKIEKMIERIIKNGRRRKNKRNNKINNNNNKL